MSSEIITSSPDVGRYATFLEAVDATIQVHLSDKDFSAERLSKSMHLSRMQLHRKLKSAAGCSTTHYIRRKRLEAAKRLLRTSDWKVNKISLQLGFSSPSYFTRCFVEEYGETPSGFREMGEE